jgi:hypothetical protein
MAIEPSVTPDAVPGVPDPRWPKLHPVSRGVDKLVFLLDSAVPIPGTKFRVGIDPVLGFLLPGAGDALGGVVSLSVVFLALQYRMPLWVVLRMVWNIATDTAVGGIPFVGDVFDVVFKSNNKNLELLDQHRTSGPHAPVPVSYWFFAALLLLAAAACASLPILLVFWLAHRLFG